MLSPLCFGNIWVILFLQEALSTSGLAKILMWQTAFTSLLEIGHPAIILRKVVCCLSSEHGYGAQDETGQNRWDSSILQSILCLASILHSSLCSTIISVLSAELDTWVLLKRKKKKMNHTKETNNKNKCMKNKWMALGHSNDPQQKCMPECGKRWGWS